MHVRQQLQYIAGQGYLFKEPKKDSRRDIPMPLPLNAVLRNVRKDQQAIKDIYAESEPNEYKDLDLVFCNYDGSELDGTGVTKRFQRLLVKHNLPKIRFHALRHTFATMCRAAGMDLGDVQDLLGHADISTTKKMYTHVEIEPLRKAMDKFTEYMEIES
ncbi:MAG: site-specific integrase [Syntrophomonas sp.]|nr:site-specific integrase [Syntrophomonas sp.]